MSNTDTPRLIVIEIPHQSRPSIWETRDRPDCALQSEFAARYEWDWNKTAAAFGFDLFSEDDDPGRLIATEAPANLIDALIRGNGKAIEHKTGPEGCPDYAYYTPANEPDWAPVAARDYFRDLHAGYTFATWAEAEDWAAAYTGHQSHEARAALARYTNRTYAAFEAEPAAEGVQ